MTARGGHSPTLALGSPGGPGRRPRRDGPRPAHPPRRPCDRPTRCPLGTMVVNASGSLVLGFLTGLSLYHGLGPHVLAVAGFGLCGGYTTWSTASWETLHLVRSGHRPRGRHLHVRRPGRLPGRGRRRPGRSCALSESLQAAGVEGRHQDAGRPGLVDPAHRGACGAPRPTVRPRPPRRRSVSSASASASRVWRLSVSVGSIISASSTISGKYDRRRVEALLEEALAHVEGLGAVRLLAGWPPRAPPRACRAGRRERRRCRAGGGGSSWR